ncbi:hypothetical protein DICSQDRAFT_164317 [Dichomitus squalens LYAD-421 SS1]|uniref:uncharacterized protein n=1 Tax=Dichomitus squalens (strain LYAD-421) TaxID=732165 RepID=UPI00044124EF|nr:uncharacterized protein DICSQDRAFT_164317 [Dichomitus squalens LYAD-421 SS1]EJF66475.1 hypothetical protein DICSQDRAFT_164317 [Dichomitus squalens LYAD-421 SS1]
MTAYHDPHSIEAKKARYSQELAAYTLRQWDSVRHSIEDGDSSESSGPPSQQQDRSRSASRDSETAARPRGIQVHDYAQTSRRHLNGQRTIAAGKA